MVVTLPANGKNDWTDYQDYWRDDDAEWMQERTILRYANATARDADWGSPTPGQVIYNQAAGVDQLEVRVGTAPAKWIGVLASQHLGVFPKNSANDTDAATIGHRSAGGAGIQFFQTVSSENKVALNNSYLDIGAGAIVAKGTGGTAGFTVTGIPTTLATTKIKTGAVTATLTTDATYLISDVPLKATIGTSAFGAVSMTGALTGATDISTTTATIGGVSVASNAVNASAGFISQQGFFGGTGTLAQIRQRDSATPFTKGSAGFDITSTIVLALGTTFDTLAPIRILGAAAKPIQFYPGTTSASPGTLLGNLGPVVVSATTPTVANYPEGTIWVTP